MPHKLTGTLDRFEEKLAVIKTLDGGEIFWPIKNLPDEVKAGDSLTLTLETDREQTSGKAELAKSMLNEILNTNDEPSEQRD
ncbi:MAG TPA: DUF3006 domain-containing protein [Patescibacteria group bacterium]|nr:DUF3006 domain-containing protein [Patescibacteria group bacterium]